MNKEVKEILCIIKSCAMDYDKQEEGMHTFDWADLWILNEYIKELKDKLNQLETNRDEAIEYIKNTYDDVISSFIEDKPLTNLKARKDLLLILERGKK